MDCVYTMGFSSGSLLAGTKVGRLAGGSVSVTWSAANFDGGTMMRLIYLAGDLLTTGNAVRDAFELLSSAWT